MRKRDFESIVKKIEGAKTFNDIANILAKNISVDIRSQNFAWILDRPTIQKDSDRVAILEIAAVRTVEICGAY